MHVPEFGHEPHRLPGLPGRARIDPPTHFGAVDHEIDHGLHAHRLDDVERDVELLEIGPEVAAPLGNVLGTQTEDQTAPDMRLVALGAVRRNLERQAIGEPSAQSAATRLDKLAIHEIHRGRADESRYE